MQQSQWKEQSLGWYHQGSALLLKPKESFIVLLLLRPRSHVIKMERMSYLSRSHSATITTIVSNGCFSYLACD